LFKQQPDKSAFGIFTLLKLIPDNDGIYKFNTVIAAAALFEMDLLILL
jgi:hypothetical protein